MTRSALDLETLKQTVAAMAGRRVVVLGDCMVDRYLWGRVDRISPEAPVPVVEVERESETLGGAANVAANLAALGVVPVLIGVVGDDAEGTNLAAVCEANGVSGAWLQADSSRPTTVKTRIIAHSQQVVRADRESRANVDGPTLEALRQVIAKEVAQSDGMVVSDYGKGVIVPSVLDVALEAARKKGVAVSVDPKESHIDHYRGVSILTPNQHEAGYVQGRRVVDEESLMAVGWGLQKRLDVPALLVTRGPDGMSLFEKGGTYLHLPTVAREVFDVTGAGDTVVGVVAAALAAGAAYPVACELANHAAGVVIREVGTASCSPAELLASLEAHGVYT